MNLEDRNKVPLKTVSLKVTGTNWTSDRAEGTPYQDLAGNWFIFIYIEGTLSVTNTFVTLTVAGVSFITGTWQTMATMTASTAYNNAWIIGPVSINIRSAVSAVVHRVQGILKLDSKPDFVE